jgi:hypothetical protein
MKMSKNQNCVCVDEAQIAEAVARLKDDFAGEFGRDVPTEIISDSVKRWLERHLDGLSEDLYETLSSPRNEAAREFRRLVDEAVGDIPILTTAATPAEEADVFTGHRPFSFEKLAAMTAYIAHRGRDVYKTKLNKLLFYSDFVHYHRTGTSISGARYVHLPYGPVPDRYEGMLAKLAAVETIWFERRGDFQLIKGWNDPLIGTLSNEERETLDWVLERLGSLNSSELTRQSHRERGYRSTRLGEPIAYAYAKFLEILTRDVPLDPT